MKGMTAGAHEIATRCGCVASRGQMGVDVEHRSVANDDGRLGASLASSSPPMCRDRAMCRVVSYDCTQLALHAVLCIACSSMACGVHSQA